MPDGCTDWYYPINPGSNPVDYAPAATTGSYHTLVKDTITNRFTLVLSDRSATYLFSRPFVAGGVDYYAMTEIADRSGHALVLGYSNDPVPRLLSLTDANGNASTVAYNLSGQATQINDPFGANAQFSYATVGGKKLLSAITDQAGYTSLLGYDSIGRLNSLTIPLTAPNTTWQFSYSGTSGRVTSVTDPYGNARTYASTATTTTLTDSLGRQTIFDFSNNDFGGAGTVTDALGNQTLQTFDADRNLIQTINARGYFSRYSYDTKGNRLTQADYLNPYPDTSLSVQRSWTYDANNNLLSSTDPLGTQSWTYNAANQPISWTDNLGHTTTYSYDGLGRLLTIVDRNGTAVVTNTYDVATGRLATSANALGDTTSFTWDSRGRKFQVTDPASNTTTYAYDLLGRPTTITYPDSTTMQFAYNCCRHTQTIDQLNNVTTMVFDDLGRQTQVTDPTGAVINATYDAVGNLTSLTDSNSHTWQWQYDALNRRTNQFDPLSNQEIWSYDSVGNVTQQVDGENAATSYNYDAFNRLTQISYPDGSNVSMTYDAVGNRSTATNHLGQWSWTYNANSWVTSVKSPAAPVATQYQYDHEGHCTLLIDPDGNATSIAYDQAYRVDSVDFLVNGQTKTVSYQRDVRGLVVSRTLPNGIVSAYAYDALGRVTSIQHAQSNSTVLFSFSYQYDGAGNLTQETSQRWDTVLGATIAYQSNYAYDARYQLSTETYNQAGSLALDLDYTYDQAGNRISLVATNPTIPDSPVTVTSNYSADNQIAQAIRISSLVPTQTTTYVEDDNGNLTQAVNSVSGTTTYSYDFERRLTKVDLPSGSNVQFAHNVDGLRVRKTDLSGVVINYLLDGLQVLLEKSNAGATLVRYIPGLARIVGAAASYYLEDRLGTVVGLTDSSQNVTDTVRNDSWGNIIRLQGTTNSPYQWVGEAAYFFSPDSGTYLLGLRHYVPSTGRFLTRDPIGLNGGTLNFYEYVSNRPTRYIDPTGMVIKCRGLSGFGGYGVAGSGSVVHCSDNCVPPTTAYVFCAGVGGGVGLSGGWCAARANGCLTGGWSGQLTFQGSVGIFGAGASFGLGSVTVGGGLGLGGGLTGTLEGCYTL